MERMKAENVMTKIKMLAAISGMAGVEEGMGNIDASTEYKHKENDLLNEIEQMVKGEKKDFSVGQCWNCKYRHWVDTCQYREEFEGREGYSRCDEWMLEKINNQ